MANTPNGSFELTVNDINDDPVCSNGSGSVTQGTPANLDVSGSFSDPDNDTLSFSATGFPAGSSLSLGVTGTITGTPTNDDVLASPINLMITANDGRQGTVTCTYTLTVNDINDDPVCSNGSGSVTQGTPANLDISGSFSDPDNDTLSFSATGFPAGSSLSLGVTGTIIGTPTNDDVLASPISLMITANDGRQGTVTCTYTLTVNDINDDPVCSNGSGSVTQGTPANLDVSGSFSDPDNDTLSFSATRLSCRFVTLSWRYRNNHWYTDQR